MGGGVVAMVDQVMSGRWCGSDGGSGDEWEVVW